MGNLYIADTGNERIRAVHFAGYPVLALTNVSTNNAGNYAVVIANPYGSVTSAVATLTVLGQPVILVQPASEEVLAGGDATLSVTATGTPPLYFFWYVNLTNLLQAGTNAALVVSDASDADAGSYTVVITNAYGTATSGVATLTVRSAPAAPPLLAVVPDQSINVGSSLFVTNTVSETNVPPRQITFSLGAGAPARAVISTEAFSNGVP